VEDLFVTGKQKEKRTYEDNG